jgi:hypothetical protein
MERIYPKILRHTKRFVILQKIMQFSDLVQTGQKDEDGLRVWRLLLETELLQKTDNEFVWYLLGIQQIHSLDSILAVQR